MLYAMPVYEFVCNACGAPVSVFVRSMNSPVNGVCGRCGSADLRRLVSRFAVLHSDGGVGLEDIDDADPRAMAHWARRLREEMGADAGPEMDDMIARMERGEMPVDDDDLAGLAQHDDLHGGLDDE
jgi:putative FmdB family regulatory protein